MSVIYWNPAPFQETDDPRMAKGQYCAKCCPDIWNALPRTSTVRSIPSLNFASEQPMNLDEDRYFYFKEYLEEAKPNRRYFLRGTNKMHIKGIVSGHLMLPKVPPKVPAKFDTIKEIKDFVRSKIKPKKILDKNPADITIGKNCTDIQNTRRDTCQCDQIWEKRLMRRLGRYLVSLRLKVSKTVARFRINLLHGKPAAIVDVELPVVSNLQYRCSDITINGNTYVSVDLL